MTQGPHYFPILKGRLGEFTALRQMHGQFKRGYTPIFEVMPDPSVLNEDGTPNLGGVNRTIEMFGKRLSNAQTKDTPTVAVDTGLLPREVAVDQLARVIHDQRASALDVIPVVRPSDTPEFRELAALVDVSTPVIIRVAGDDLDDADAPVDEAITGCIAALGVDPANATVLVDLGAFAAGADDMGFRVRFARLILSEIPDSVQRLALGSGAFPADLNDVRPNDSKEFPRLDAQLWSRVKDRYPDSLGYADYAIANPVGVGGVPFAPAPQIRYTRDESWLIIKGRRNDRRSSMQFVDICGQISALPDFDRSTSWADEQIADLGAFAGRDAEDLPQGMGPGNAMKWRSYGTNHHMSLVLKRLAQTGAP